MEFRRYDGFANHIPQEFIDYRMPVCPFCGTDTPHWLLAQKAELNLSGGRNYYRCDCCGGVLSSSLLDVSAEKGKGFAINPTAAALNALHKRQSGQAVTVPFLRVEELGRVCVRTELLGREEPLTFFQELAKSGSALPAAEAPSASAAKSTSAGTAFCRHCGASVLAENAFCPACGQRLAPPSNKAFCRHCGVQIVVGSAFCPTCGKPQAASSPAVTAPVAPAPVSATSASAEPVPETPARPRRGGALAIIAGILFLLYAMMRTVDCIHGVISFLDSIVGDAYWLYLLKDSVMIVLFPVLHITGAVLAGVSLLSRKKTGGVVVGLGLLLTEFLGGIVGLNWESCCFTLALMLLLALVLFNGIPALQRKSRVLNRLWFLSLIFIGIGLILFFALSFRYSTPFGAVEMLLLSMALVLFSIWNAVDSAPYTLAVKTGDALAVLGGVLLLRWAVWAGLGALQIVFTVPANIASEIIFTLLRVGGYGLLGVLLLARKKNAGLLVGAALSFVAWMSNLLYNSAHFIRLGDFGQFSVGLYFVFLVLLAVFNGIPPLRRRQPVINKLWFIPLLLFLTNWLLFEVMQISITAFSADLVVAVTAFALWCRAAHDK